MKLSSSLSRSPDDAGARRPLPAGAPLPLGALVTHSVFCLTSFWTAHLPRTIPPRPPRGLATAAPPPPVILESKDPPVVTRFPAAEAGREPAVIGGRRRIEIVWPKDGSQSSVKEGTRESDAPLVIAPSNLLMAIFACW